jgi:sugar phosphate isomerase/epimerase
MDKGKRYKKGDNTMDQRVALELYTVRDETERDFVGTLRQVAQMGYPGVEFAGFGNVTAQALAALLAEIGLQAVAAHIPLVALQGERLDTTLRYCKEIGCPYIVLPWLAEEWRTQAKFQELAPQLNDIGARCQREGFVFGYHNHNFEFARVDGGYLFDTLLQATDPSLVKIELDVYWVAFAGVDPIAFLQTHADRIALIHMKDMASDRSMTEVGKGILDMQSIWSFAQSHGLWGIVEHDHPQMPSLESARISLEYFR